MLNEIVWNMLAKSTGSPTGVVALRLRPESKFNVFAALDKKTGNRFVLLKSNRTDMHPAQPLPSGRGFNVQYMVTPSDPDGASCLQLELTDPAYVDVFDVIGNDVLQNIVGSGDETAALDTFIGRICEWQSFLDQLPHDGLGEQAQQGLFGELWFLREFLIPEIGSARAVRSWAGPKALAKDFQLTAVAFEVKANSTKQHSRFSISNEMQLDLHGVRTLILYCLLLERLVAGGMSLPELVTAIRLELQPDHRTAIVFSELLLQSGYIDSDAALYTTRFAIRSQHFFDVRDNFPRIVEADLRPGVGDVHYSILFSECERYVVTEAETRNLIRQHHHEN